MKIINLIKLLIYLKNKEFLNSLFLVNVLLNLNKKTNYSFNPPILKKIEKNKIYILEFASNDIKLIQYIKI